MATKYTAPKFGPSSGLPSWMQGLMDTSKQQSLLEQSYQTGLREADRSVAERVAGSSAERGLSKSGGIAQDLHAELLAPAQAALLGERLRGQLAIQQAQQALVPSVLDALLMREDEESAGGSSGYSRRARGGGGARALSYPGAGGGGAAPRGYPGGGGGGANIIGSPNDWGPGFGVLGSQRGGVFRGADGRIQQQGQGQGQDPAIQAILQALSGSGTGSGRTDSVPGFAGGSVAIPPGTPAPAGSVGSGVGAVMAKVPSGIVMGLNPAGLDSPKPITPIGNSASPYGSGYNPYQWGR